MERLESLQSPADGRGIGPLDDRESIVKQGDLLQR